MLNEPTLPPGLPSFWSDQHGSRIQYVGHAELADRVEISTETDESGLSVRYLHADRLVAALAIDEPRVIAAAARAIEQTDGSNTEEERSDHELQSKS